MGSEVLAQLGRDAMLRNRPRYAVEVLERIDPERGWIPSWTPYWQRLTEAYHMVGEHERAFFGVLHEWGTRPTLVYWSYGYIEMLGEELSAARSAER